MKKYRRVILLLSLLLHSVCFSQSRQNIYQLSDQKNMSDFQIIYEQDVDLKYSSKDSIFHKRYLTGSKKVKVGLTKDEKTQILKTIKESDFLNLPNIIKEGENECVLPCFYTRITISINSKSKSVYYSGFCDIADSIIEKRFYSVDNQIRDILNKKKEIKNLPESDIIYY